MTEQAYQLKASVTGEDDLGRDSCSKSNNCEVFVDIKQDVEGNETNPFSDSGVEELFKNIPEIKEIFQVKSKIGEGTFSNVYLANIIDNTDQLFALKYIIPTSSPERVEREIRCLQEMGGIHNVVGYKGTLRNRDHSAIVLPYFHHDKFQDYLPKMTVENICDYMKNLFEALQHIHSFSIIHRDVKPGNFLYSCKTKKYNLVDFGLAMHEPGSNKAWDIEKKNVESPKNKHSKKNVRLLSPESAKSAQLTKKPRTSPRFSIPSNKLARQTPNIGTKLSSKSSLKITSQTNKHDISKSSKNDTKLVQKNNGQQRHSGNKNGLCATNHKRIEVCSLCMKRNTQNAPRAGTSGFRAPEVLMKFPKQTTALDIWSAGVIMLCLLSGRYPFFRCFDDMTALAQIITLFGKQRVAENATSIGKYLVCNATSPGFDLKHVCQKLRLASNDESTGESGQARCCKKCIKTIKKQEKYGEEVNSPKNTRLASVSAIPRHSQPDNKGKVRFMSTGHAQETGEKREEHEEHLDGTSCVCKCGTCSNCVPNSAYELLERCLDLNPETRITATEALRHSFFANNAQLVKPER